MNRWLIVLIIILTGLESWAFGEKEVLSYVPTRTEISATQPAHSTFTTRLKEANYLLETWQVDAGFKALLSIAREREDDQVTLFLLAKAHFLKGNYDEAVKYLDKVRFMPTLGSGWGTFAEFVRQTREAAKGFEEYSSHRFRLRVKPGADEILVPYALDTLEKAYVEIGTDLGFFPEEKVLIEIYPDFESFNIASSLSRRDMEVSGAIGIAKFNRIMIVSPRAAARGYRYLDTLAHEYIHYVIYRITKSEATIWLQEGTAKFLETRWRERRGGYLSPGSKSLLARAVKTGKKITFAQMEPSLVKLPSAHDVQQAFAQVTMAIDYIIQTAGKEKFKEFFWKLGEGKSIQQALEEITGYDFQIFEENYWKYIQEKGFEIIPGLSPEGFEFKEGAGGEEDREKLLKKIESTEGQRLALLGDLLFNEKRYAASRIEYKRALEIAPNSAIITIRLAKTLEYLGEIEEAEKLYRQILEIHPGFTSAYDNLAEIYLSRKELSKAWEMLEQTNAINPFNSRTHELLAFIYAEKGLEDKLEAEMRNLKILGRP